MPSRYFLRADRVRELADQRHLTHSEVAHRLGVSRAHWSLLLNRHRALTPTARRLILDSAIFDGVSERELWERVALPLPHAA
jgi:transcriptional regulator with XRE-family HTH domain